MVILGLGSNIFDRLLNLRKALDYLRKLEGLTVKEVSPVYRSDALVLPNAPPEWDMPYFNVCLRCETTLPPIELLKKTKQIEKKVGRTPGLPWGPRIIDIDILAWDEHIIQDQGLHIPHEELERRPFALLPLADVAPFWIYPMPGPLQGKTALEMIAPWETAAPFNTKVIEARIDTPQLMGVINVTPDSFSDGGFATFASLEALVEQGATILDIGAESTGPSAKPIDCEEEWRRLEPFLAEIKKKSSQWLYTPQISIDTYHPKTAARALEWGVDIINDVTGLANPLMQEVLAESQAKIVYMHNLGVPVAASQWLPLNANPVEIILEWAQARILELEIRGIERSRLIFDPGLGFGKNAELSFFILKNIALFKTLEQPILVGHSRKSFLKQFTQVSSKERDLETSFLSTFLADAGVDYLRLHNLDYHSRLFKIWGKLGRTPATV
jgi:2-amino-4-hydroxy-6-hydroxymethyldihydropteridine diphosphokinase/dihydropteroate synthase